MPSKRKNIAVNAALTAAEISEKLVLEKNSRSKLEESTLSTKAHSKKLSTVNARIQSLLSQLAAAKK